MNRPFQANAGAATKRLAAGTTPSTSISLGILGPNDVIRIYNAGTAIAYIAFGDSTVSTVVPVAGTGTGGTAGGMPCGSGITEVQASKIETSGSTNVATYVAGITSASTADLYFTIGQGA